MHGARCGLFVFANASALVRHARCQYCQVHSLLLLLTSESVLFTLNATS